MDISVQCTVNRSKKRATNDAIAEQVLWSQQHGEKHSVKDDSITALNNRMICRSVNRRRIEYWRRKSYSKPQKNIYDRERKAYCSRRSVPPARPCASRCSAGPRAGEPLLSTGRTSRWRTPHPCCFRTPHCLGLAGAGRASLCVERTNRWRIWLNG